MFMELVSHLLTQIRSGEIGAGLFSGRVIGCWDGQPQDVCGGRARGVCTWKNYDATRFALQAGRDTQTRGSNAATSWAHDANDRPVFTVEHILPRPRTLGPGWVTMLEGIRKALRAAIRAVLISSTTDPGGCNSKLGTMGS